MIVVKLGGNAAWPRGTASIDDHVVNELFTYLADRFDRFREQMIVLPGGIGGQVFIEWARRASSSNAFLNEVGCALISLSSRILIQAATAKVGDRLRVCPSLATSLDDIARCLQVSDCVFTSVPVQGALTSDSVAALVAEHFGASLLLVKNHPPFADAESAGCYDPGDASRLDLDRSLEYVASKFSTSRAGHFPSLDPLCLAVLKRSLVRAHILTRAALLGRAEGGEPDLISIVQERP